MLTNSEIVAIALTSLTQQRDTINEQIRQIQQSQDGGLSLVPATTRSKPHKKHRISAEGRAKIAAAQRRRWAAKKKQA